MTRSNWLFHPITILVFSIIALGMSLYLYIYWYLEVSTGLEAVIQRFNIDRGQILESRTWVVIMVLSILVGIILIGIFIIFLYNFKTYQLYRLQHNFISNFTHELKTPVTSLKLYLETFLKYDLSRQDRDKYLGYMITDVDRLSANINSILNLARIESKSYDSDFVTTDLVQFIEKFCKDNRHLFRNSKINIHNHSGEAFLYSIDHNLFDMLLMNLMTNALKYNRSDVPVVDIRIDIHGGKLHIRFEDNGIGVDQAEIRKIFKKFYQVGQSDDRSAKGSGLGLYLVENIARIHKGKITAQSQGKGKGSVFTLILPYTTGV